MPFLKKKNFAASSLSAGIDDDDTSLTVVTGDGIKFPSSGTFVCVVWGAEYDSPDLDSAAEIVYVTARSTDSFTISRAQESTTAIAWASGDKIAHVVTAGTFDDLDAIVDLSAASTDYSLDIGQSAKIDFASQTSVALHVATSASGVYRIFYLGDHTNTTYTASSTYLRPNNTTYSGEFIYYEMGKEVSFSEGGGSSSPDSYRAGEHDAIQIGYQQLISGEWVVITKTEAKSLSGTHRRKASGTTGVFTWHQTLWEDTDTAWSSLGTVVFPFNHSGTFIVERIA